MKKFVVAGAIFISGLCVPGLLPAKEVNFDQIIRALAPGVQGAYEKLQRSIDLEIQFETNSATLTKQAQKQLAALAKALVSDHLSGSHTSLQAIRMPGAPQLTTHHETTVARSDGVWGASWECWGEFCSA